MFSNFKIFISVIQIIFLSYLVENNLYRDNPVFIGKKFWKLFKTIVECVCVCVCMYVRERNHAISIPQPIAYINSGVANIQWCN